MCDVRLLPTREYFPITISIQDAVGMKVSEDLGQLVRNDIKSTQPLLGRRFKVEALKTKALIGIADSRL